MKKPRRRRQRRLLFSRWREHPIRRKSVLNTCRTSKRLLSRLSRVPRERGSGNSVDSRPWLSRGRRVTGWSRSSRIAMNEIRSTTAWSRVRPPRWINPLPLCRVDAPRSLFSLLRRFTTSTHPPGTVSRTSTSLPVTYAILLLSLSLSPLSHRPCKRTNNVAAVPMPGVRLTDTTLHEGPWNT